MQVNILLQKVGRNKSQADGNLRTCKKLSNELAIILLI